MFYINIFKIIEERGKIPIRRLKNDSDQLEYILRKLKSNEDDIFFIVPDKYFLSFSSDIQSLREKLFEKYNLAGVYDMNRLYLNIGIYFSLFHFSKKNVKKVKFVKSNNNDMPTCNFGNKGYLELQESSFCAQYREYIVKIEKICNGKTLKDSVGITIFSEKYANIQKNRIYLDYYLPEFQQNRAKLQNEEVVLLRDIAEVITPKRQHETDNGDFKQLYVKNFKYPLEYDELSIAKGISTKLIKGDIVLSTHGKFKAYLYNANYNNIVPTPNCVIIRLNSNKEYNTYYLYNYLTKQVATKYFSSLAVGSVINFIRKIDILDLPIIKPTKKLLQIAKQEFDLTSRYDRFNISEFNKVINKNEWDNETEIQVEIMAMLKTSIKDTKFKKLKQIIESDLMEITNCINVGAYKSSIIMCGSVLEGFLLDWVSNTSKHFKYIEKSSGKLVLNDLINELKVMKLSNDVIETAHRIRRKRNAVHPKVTYQKGFKCDKETAISTLKDLKKVVESNY